MKCPECGSNNTKRVEVIFDQGTSDSSATSLILGSNADAVAVTSGRSQTRLAQKVSPPKKKDIFGPLFLLLLSLVFFVFIFFSKDFSLGGPWYIGLFLLLMFILSIRFLMVNLKFNKFEWPKIYESWLKSWCCLKCGNIFKGKNDLRVDSKMVKRKVFSPSGSGKSFLVGLVAALLDGINGKR